MFYNFRTNCPLTQDEWNERGHEYCKSQLEEYHCMYNNACKLVEFCQKENYNNFQIYLNISGPLFFKKNRNKIHTNSMNYWIIQDIVYCKKRTWIPETEKSMISFTTGQPTTCTTSQPTTCTTSQPSDNGKNVYIILFITASSMMIGLLVYINRNRIASLASVCINIKTPTETEENEKFKPPAEETDFISVPEGTERIALVHKIKNIRTLLQVI